MVEWKDTRPKYPWELWLNGESHTLTEGVDFTTPMEVFRTTISNTSRRKGKYVHTIKKGNQIILEAYADREEYKASKDQTEYDDGYSGSGPEA